MHREEAQFFLFYMISSLNPVQYTPGRNRVNSYKQRYCRQLNYRIHLTSPLMSRFSRSCEKTAIFPCLRDFVGPPSTSSPPLTLKFSSVNKVCDFSSFSHLLQLRANLDMSLSTNRERENALFPSNFVLHCASPTAHYDVKSCMFPLLARPSSLFPSPV